MMGRAIRTNAFKVILPLGLLLLGLLPLPLRIASAESPAESGPGEQVLERLQTATYDVSSVELEGQSVTVAYRQSALQDQTSLPYIWLDMMAIVADELPEVEQVILDVSYLQEPYIELVISGNAIRAVMADQMSLADFMAAIEFKDKRPLETVLSGAFIEYGYPFAGYKIEGTTLQFPLLVEFPNPDRDLAAIVDIASQVAVLDPQLEIVEIIYWRASGDQVTFLAQTADLIAFDQGELPLLAMMAELEVMGKTNVARSPALGRMLGLLNLVLAGIAFGFYGAISLRLRSWPLALKAGASVVLPALVAGAIMLILML